MYIKGYLQNHWTIPFPSRYSDTCDMRWEAFGARLNTHRGFGPCVWAFLPFEGIQMQCDDYKDTYIEIQMGYDDTYGIWWYRWNERPLRPVWVHTEALGRVSGRFVLWGLDYACKNMMRYEMTFPRLSVVAPGHDSSLIACSLRSEYDEIISLGTCLMIVFGIQYLIL